MFWLSVKEHRALRSQSVILESRGRGKHRKYAPRAFTQEGVAMLSGVLRSERAVQVNIAIMRTFVRLRQVLADDETLAGKVARHDREIEVLFKHVRALLEPPGTPGTAPGARTGADPPGQKPHRRSLCARPDSH